MARSQAATGLLEAASLRAVRKVRALAGNVRVVVTVSLVLIAGCFASAAVIQMRLDREHALAQAAALDIRRADGFAGELSSTLERLAAVGKGFADASIDAESGAALAEAGGPALRNVAVLDLSGHLLSEMKGAPQGLLPLSPAVLAQARAGRFVGPSADGRNLVMVLASNGHLVAVEVDLQTVVSRSPDALVAMPSGRLLAVGGDWKSLPDVAAVALPVPGRASRILEFSTGSRLVSLASVAHWPLVAGTSVDVGQALDAWYGALPLYLFIIIGPALAGAGLAAVFVREFERRLRAAAAMRALRSTRPEEARLLVRLADAERRAKDADGVKADFMSHMSHELRTPLNAIIGFSEVIETSLFGATGHPKYVEYARDIGRAGRQLHARVGDILDYVNLDAGRYRIDSRPVDVSALARHGMEAMREAARDRGVRLLVALSPDARALADETAIRRIFAAIFSNAVQFSPEGAEVRLSVKRRKDFVVATVRDGGIGFTDAELAQVGEAFRRFDRPGHATGLGLGLAIATTLARRMGGSLRIASVRGEGTTVELHLPAASGSR